LRPLLEASHGPLKAIEARGAIVEAVKGPLQALGQLAESLDLPTLEALERAAGVLLAQLAVGVSELTRQRVALGAKLG